MSFIESHILSLLLLLPFLSALFVALMPSGQAGLIRKFAIASSTLTFFVSCLLLLYPLDNLHQFSQYIVWSERLGTAYAVGVDGISLPMIVLTSLLCWVAIIASACIKEGQKGYYLLILLLETAILGVFMARDWALFYIFWEMTLIPLFFLIDRWGGKNRQSAALNFVLYTMGGSVFMLVSMLVLFDKVPEHSFSMSAMSSAAQLLEPTEQVLIFLGFLIGFGVKMPIFPIHGWLPLAHVEAPSPISILLSGILLKMGAYGLLRVAPMLPEAMLKLQELLMALALFSIIYGGLLAWRQYDLKKMIAYSSVSHMGIVLLGISTLNITGLTGAVAQMTAHGLVAGATFMLIGLLYERTKTRDIREYSSLTRVTPRFAVLLTLTFIAGVGLPGSFGFVAELHVLMGGFQRWGWWMAFVSLGVIISAIYSLRTVGRLFTGPVRSSMSKVEDIHPTEMLAVVVLLTALFLFGLIPSLVLDKSIPALQLIARLFNGG
ncbi:MAG: NADH-quinone oxidoreductase subunit M [Thiotrichaceae bacterium]|nr:NADH-quinone oxidoreductase subunit M [Thiotrichaceae bacterium]